MRGEVRLDRDAAVFDVSLYEEGEDEDEAVSGATTFHDPHSD
jgi:hypothetical protein